MSNPPDSSVTMPPKLTMKSLYSQLTELQQDNLLLVARVEELERQLEDIRQHQRRAITASPQPSPEPKKPAADLTCFSHVRLPQEIVTLVAAINGSAGLRTESAGRSEAEAANEEESRSESVIQLIPEPPPSLVKSRAPFEISSLVAAITETASVAGTVQNPESPFEAAFEAAYGPDASIPPIPGLIIEEMESAAAAEELSDPSISGNYPVEERCTAIAEITEVPVFISRSTRHPKKKLSIWQRWFGWFSKPSHHRAGHASS
jgi:hypothetical protein